TWDAVAMRLTGRAATSLVEGQPFPSSEVLAAAGLPPGKVAPTMAAGTVVGGLTGDAAATLGLRAGIPVVAGIVDAWASFHGAGITRAGAAMDPGGSDGVLDV